MARFAGKGLIKTGVKAPIKDGKGVIQQALVAKPFDANGDGLERRKQSI